MELIECLGSLAGTLTTFSFLPQVIKIWRTHDVGSISALMYVILGLGVGCWTLYGWAMHSPSMVVTNFITLLLVVSILSLKMLIDFGYIGKKI